VSTSSSSRGNEKRILRPSGYSAKTKQDHLRSTSSGIIPARPSSYENSAPSNQITLPLPSQDFARNVMDFRPKSVSSIQPRSEPPMPRCIVATTSSLSLCQGIKNNLNASSKVHFIPHPLVTIFGPEVADWIAAKFHWSPPLPSQVLLARSNESGKSYSARNAKRKRLSNSPASLKKR
jgi:hypothetical protein